MKQSKKTRKEKRQARGVAVNEMLEERKEKSAATKAKKVRECMHVWVCMCIVSKHACV